MNYETRIQDKTKQLEQIERDLLDIRDIHTMLRDLVIEQQEPLSTIQQNVESTREHMVSANKELETANKSIKRRRKWTTYGLIAATAVVSVPVTIIAGIKAVPIMIGLTGLTTCYFVIDGKK